MSNLFEDWWQRFCEIKGWKAHDHKNLACLTWNAALGSVAKPQKTDQVPESGGWFWIKKPDDQWCLRHLSFAHGTHWNKGLGYWADCSGFGNSKKFMSCKTDMPPGTLYYGPIRPPE